MALSFFNASSSHILTHYGKSFSKEEQALYDKAHISRDIRNQCFMWAIIMLAGALLSCFLTPYIAIPTYIIWLVLFFREVHFDNHKAFEKYLLK